MAGKHLERWNFQVKAYMHPNLRKSCLTWSRLHAPRPSLCTHTSVLRASSLHRLSLLLPQELLWPVFQPQEVPALPLLPLVWASSAPEASRHVHQAGFFWGFAPWTASGLAKRTRQEHITGSREALREGLPFLWGAGCQRSSPTVRSLTLGQQVFQWNHLWGKVSVLKRSCALHACYIYVIWTCTPPHPLPPIVQVKRRQGTGEQNIQ